MITSSEVATEILDSLTAWSVVSSSAHDVVDFDAIDEVKVIWFLLILISIDNERSTFPAKCELDPY